jgi:hypothetical protein
MIVEHPPEYVAARRVLLDALDALGSQRRSVILVGAQAIYLRCGRGDLAMAPMTTDADLAMHADWVYDEPELYAAMQAAGFNPDEQPGKWRGPGDVCVDLMVVPHQSGRKNKAARAANIPPHRKGVARIVRGLEPSLIDHSHYRVEPLGGDDRRSFDILVAGTSASARLPRLAADAVGGDRVIPASFAVLAAELVDLLR